MPNHRTSISEIEFPAWCNDNDIPVTKDEIREIFLNLGNIFGFQKSSQSNMFQHLMSQLDSRASRSNAHSALLSLHSDYIGGQNSNFKKWYFAAQLDLDDQIGFKNLKNFNNIIMNNKRNWLGFKKNRSANKNLTNNNIELNNNHLDALSIAEYNWNSRMKKLTSSQLVKQLALYLLCWGECNQIRFTPECLCFIFKCALDWEYYISDNNIAIETDEFTFLTDIIDPIYNFLRDQVFKQGKNTENNQIKWIRRNRDHKDIIGYDDVNQLFWYPEGIAKIVLYDGTRLIDLPIYERYNNLKNVNWQMVFYKTFKETRTWLHCLTNFNRFWIIHLVPFWFFTTLNAPTLYMSNYIQLLNNQPVPQVKLTIIALGGTIACLIQIGATIAEWWVVPRDWPGAQHLTTRFIGLLFCLGINVLPSIYILALVPRNVFSHSAYIIAIIQLIIAILTTILFVIRPLGGIFYSYLDKADSLNQKNGNKGKGKVRKNKNKNTKIKHGTRKFVSSQTFTAMFPVLRNRNKWFSLGLWFFVFVAKFIESYFFLTLSMRDPIRILSTLNSVRCQGDVLLGGAFLCKLQPWITLFLMLFCDLILFFLDTYLWYIICNCIFSIIVSLSLGTSIFTPWKNIYSRLPTRIYTKILATSHMEIKFKSKLLVSQIWNSIIISMYREHLISIEHVQKLLYEQADDVLLKATSVKEPTFFIAQDDSTYKSTKFFPANSEAKRRVSYFAQSLSTPLADPMPIECMPSFTVLIPHFTEKILLNLSEIIKEESDKSRLPVLEYLKQLHPLEWKNFVRDTKLLTNELELSRKFQKDRNQGNVDGNVVSDLNFINEQEMYNNDITRSDHTKEAYDSDLDKAESFKENISDIPYDMFGFATSEPMYTIRTRIWASLRSQTLYRTISGFMNYSKAIKLLYRVETPYLLQVYGGANNCALINELENMANRKFRMLVAMQRYVEFSDEEKEATELLLRTYPNMHISFIMKEFDNELKDYVYYSCLTNGFAEYDSELGLRKCIQKIKLSGNPILGDGKSDNQNHSIIFYRGEYIQVVDANQDNYLEECLKIRSVLSDFEEMDIVTESTYNPKVIPQEQTPPVSIIGAREYIFSEHIGVLGDIAAGKEQTFGTLFARTLAEIGSKLHYGHPDFLNAIFMTTRGGISKAQKSLHLNEDIYAGINALCRGGRIKHSDYYQCGKGRDLGFGSILNFTTKIGAGMGEQLLSREYYYLGTQLPIDRFLSFFYAHPGFHLNNLFISISIYSFFLLLINLGALNHEVIKCQILKNSLITDLEQPLGCYNIQPALHWVSIFVLSIFIVFFIAFAPLLIQELLEKGLIKAFGRFLHHIFSMAPLFEVFVCQIYSNSLITNITFGGAKYISTGRGFAITRIDFMVLYSRFAKISIYSGFQIFLMLLFATLSMWQPALLWFWITVISLCFAPFIFNPHQFVFKEFFLDYHNLIHWFSEGNYKYKKESWASYVKTSRATYTGYKKKIINDLSETGIQNVNKVKLSNIYISELLIPFIILSCNFTAYTFINAQTGVTGVKPTNSVIRLILVTFFPILINTVVLLVLFAVSICTRPVLMCCHANTGSTIAFVAHGISVFIYMIDFEIMWLSEGFNFTRTLLLLITVINLHIFLFKIVTLTLLTKEYKNNKSNLAWWSGHWYNTGIGWAVILQPLREYLVKILESSFFAGDFFLTHFLLYLQTPFVLIPYFDYWHSITLFWLKPTYIIQDTRIYSKKQKRRRNKIVWKYFLLYVSLLITMLALLILPFFATRFFVTPKGYFNNTMFHDIVQPNGQNNNDTGPNAPSTILRTTPTLASLKTIR